MHSQYSRSQASMDPAEVERQRYLHHMQRRSMPPRCNPISIIVLVLALGMVFIGLTMTVIAHWPGNSSIGENPLKIAGPVLLGIGGFVFIIGMVLVCMWQGRQKEQWQKSMQQMAQSRSAMNNPYMNTSRYNQDDDMEGSQMYLNNGPSMDSKPGPGILKTPSVSTYGRGSEYGDDPNAYPRNSYPYGQQYDSDYSGNQHEVFKIDTVPDPNKQGYPAPIEQSSVDYDQQVPIPVRQTTKKKPRGSDNTGYHPEEVSPPQEKDARQMQSYSSNQGYDMYQGQSPADGGDKPAKKSRHRKRKEGEEGDKPKSRHHPVDERHNSSHSNDGYEPDASMSTSHPSGYYANVPGQGQSPPRATSTSQYPYASTTSASPNVYTGAGLTSPLSGSGGLGLAGSPDTGMGLGGMGGMGLTPGMEQQLKINIRAQPNTAVHITPTMYHTQPAQKPYNRQANMSQSSIETEI